MAEEELYPSSQPDEPIFPYMTHENLHFLQHRGVEVIDPVGFVRYCLQFTF